MRLVFLLEEKSMQYFLDGILPKIFPPEIGFITIHHDGKSALRRSIPRKLAGWNEPGVRFIIVQDQDSGDCRVLKKELVALCEKAGKKENEVLVRIACHELEAWYFGDLEAVGKAYDKNLSALSGKKNYRIPDKIENPKWELKKHIPEHQQIQGARKIAPYIDIERNTSESFRAFVSGVKRIAGIAE